MNKNQIEKYIENYFLLKLQGAFLVSFFFLLFFCAQVVFSNTAYAMDFSTSSFQLSHSEIQAINNRNTIESKFYFTNVNTQDIEKLLKDGTKIEMTIFASIVQEETFFDTEIAYKEFVYILQHDMLAREFVLVEKNGQIQRFKTVDDLFNSIFFPLEFTFAESALLDTEDYQLELEISLRHTTIPPWIEVVLFFWDWDIINTDYTFSIQIPNSKE